ncbi:hypothetical protein MUB42_07040 (plasmid) [Apilactobacillus kunkeei]|nr:hypothetical protein MUB42_07040 [Apilactobacillus kunkeei]
MLKKTMYIIGLAALVSLMLVGCGKSQSSKQSSASTISAKDLGDEKIGILAYEWVHNDQAKLENQKTNNDLYSHYDTVIKSKPNGNDDGNEEDYFLSRMCYNGRDSKSSKYSPKNYSALNFNGDGVADLKYSVDGEKVNLQYTDSAHQGDRPEYEAPRANKTVSVAELVKTYYSTPKQKKHVDNFAKSILTEDEWSKQYAAGDSDSIDD